MKQVFVILLTALSLTTFAQQQSPYSRFGVGQPYNNLTTNLKAMGNISTAFQDSIQSNLDNPAALGNRMFSTLDFAFSLNYRNQRDQNYNHAFTEGGISYFAYSFSVNKKQTWGMALGLKPLTYKKYDIATDIVNDRYFREFKGDGNTYSLFWQNGLAITENFSLGINTGLYFGSLKDETFNTFNPLQYPTNYSNSSGKTYQQKLRGVVFKAGAQYNKDISQDLNLSLGATYDLESTINDEITTDDFLFTINSYEQTDDGRINVIKRTDFNHETTTTNRDLTLPQQLAFGVYLNKNQKWSLGADAKFQDWTNFSNFNDASALLKYENALDLSLGGSFIPNYRKPERAFESFEYRYGGHYNKTYLNIDGTQIDDYGISLGVGLPIRRTLPGARLREIPSSVDIGIEIGSTGTLKNDLVQDNYVKGTIGLSLNDKWFQKKRYD